MSAFSLFIENGCNFNIKTVKPSLKRTLIQVLVEKILIIFFQYMKVEKVMHVVESATKE